jgi:large subunit ribosomal protein L21
MRSFFVAASLLAILCVCGAARSLFAATAAYDPATISGQAPGAAIYYSGLYAPQVQSLKPVQSVAAVQNPETAQRGSWRGSSMAIAAAVIGTMVGLAVGGQTATAKLRLAEAQGSSLFDETCAQPVTKEVVPEKYAIVEASGHQFFLEEGKFYDFDLMASLEAGDKFNLNKILMLKDGEERKIGKPFVDGYEIQATALRHLQGPKIRVFKYRPKKGTKKTYGHRSQKTRVLIDCIKPA